MAVKSRVIVFHHPQLHPADGARDRFKVAPVELTGVDQTFDGGRNLYGETGFEVFPGLGTTQYPAFLTHTLICACD